MPGLFLPAPCSVFRCYRFRAIWWQVPGPVRWNQQVLAESVMANGAVVTLRVGVVLGLAGLDMLQLDRLSAQALSTSPIYSGPLSQRIINGVPRHSMICSRLRMTRSAGSEKSTSIPGPSRLKSSTTLNSLEARPSSGGTTASPLFCHGFLNDLGFQPLLLPHMTPTISAPTIPAKSNDPREALET